MNLVLLEFLDTMQIIKQYTSLCIIIILFIVPIVGKNHVNYNTIAKKGVFLNFNFGDHYVDVKEKRNYNIDIGKLTWYRYPAFSYVEPTYWYFINGSKEPFALNMKYVNDELYDIKLISLNNYENVDEIKEIYIRKYGLDFVKGASGLGYSYTWLVNNIKVTIGRNNKGRGDCIIHYSIVDDFNVTR